MLSATLLLLPCLAEGYALPGRLDHGKDGLKLDSLDQQNNGWNLKPDDTRRSLQQRTSDSPFIISGGVRNYRDQIHMTSIKFGDQEFLAAIDTGSSDTWIAGTGYKCNNPKAIGDCLFGPTYNKTPSFSSTSNPFWTQYGGESAEGMMGTETVTIGNVSVKNQEVAIVNKATWRGDGSSSGLIGLGFPSNSATQLIPKPGPITYSPIFTSMHRQGLIAPYFSLALNRVNEGPGSISFGALPSAPIRYSPTFVKAPLQNAFASYEAGSKQKCGAAPSQKTPCKEIDFRTYSIPIEGFSIPSQTSLANKKMNVLIDSGTPTMNLPKDIAKAFNSGWTPPAKNDRAQGWLVECNAKPPKFGVKINGTVFEVDPKDLILPSEKGEPGAWCTSGVQEGLQWQQGGLLGATFLKSVVAVFDVGPNAEMRFAARLR
jgi:hypothetical protein